MQVIDQDADEKSHSLNSFQNLSTILFMVEFSGNICQFLTVVMLHEEQFSIYKSSSKVDTPLFFHSICILTNQLLEVTHKYV